MVWRLEFSEDVERDFALIFDHLFESYTALGESVEKSLADAGQRLLDIRADADRILIAQLRGEKHDDLLPGLRHLTINRAIFWFVVTEETETVRVLAVFFGSQNHRVHMLRRLLTG